MGESGVTKPLIRVAVFGVGVCDMCRFIDGLGVSDCVCEVIVGDVSWLLMPALMVAGCACQEVGEGGVTERLIEVAVFGVGVWVMCRFIDELGVSECGVVGDVSWLLMLALIVAGCAGQEVGEDGVTGRLIGVAVFGGVGVWDMCRFIDGLFVEKENTWLEDRRMLVLVFCPLSDKGGKEGGEKEEEEEEEEEEGTKEEKEEEEEGMKEENEAVMFLFNVLAGDIKTPCSTRENKQSLYEQSVHVTYTFNAVQISPIVRFSCTKT